LIRGLLCLLAFGVFPALAIHPATQAARDQIQLELDEVSRIEGKIIDATRKLNGERAAVSLESKQRAKTLESSLLSLKRERDLAYQRAIRLALPAYDIVPTDEPGAPTETGDMATPPLGGAQRPWIVVAMEPQALTLEAGDGKLHPWPTDNPKQVDDEVQGLLGTKNAITFGNGITLIWGGMKTPEELARLLHHEHKHFQLFQEKKWARKTTAERELEVLDFDAAAVSSIAHDEASARHLRNLIADRKTDALAARREELRKEQELGMTGRAQRWVHKTVPFLSPPHEEIASSLGDFSASASSLKEVRKRAVALNKQVTRQFEERRLAEQEQRRREEQARVERDDFQFAIYWIFNECRGTPSLPIQGNFARLLATRPDARKTLRRLASFEYTKAENAVLSECVELLIRSLPDYPNAEQIEIDRNWARRVRHEANERATVHPPAKSLPSVTRRSGPLPVIPYPSQPPQPQQPAPAQPAPEPERPYMKPCINGRCLDLH